MHFPLLGEGSIDPISWDFRTHICILFSLQDVLSPFKGNSFNSWLCQTIIIFRKQNKGITQETVVGRVFQHCRKMQLFWKLMACKCCLFLLRNNCCFWMQLFTQWVKLFYRGDNIVLSSLCYCYQCVTHIWTSQRICSVFICIYDQSAYLFKQQRIKL